MQTKVSVYIAASLDGFIARKDGSIDWLDNIPNPSGEDYGYQHFIDSIDVIVIGRNSFEKVLTFETWPYTGKRVVVLSTHALEIPDRLPKNVTVQNASPLTLIESLSKEGVTHLYVDGGITIQRFLATDLVDELTITRIPILLGDGLPLFGSIEHDIQLEHLETKTFANGLVQSKYRVIKSEAS
jgi:dihydrofolate reductase